MKVVIPKVEVVLDKSLYGVSKMQAGPAYNFYFFENGKIDQITTQNTEHLTAVTEEQYKAWKSRRIFRLPVTMEPA